LLVTMMIGMTGTVTALADTLLPGVSLKSSLLQDFATGAPALLHFRPRRPVLAVIAGVYMVWLVFEKSRGPIRGSRPATFLQCLLFAQIGIGVLNILLLAPVWIQILQLLVADGIWIMPVLVRADPTLEPVTAHSARAVP
jgi:heme a synthase